METCILYPASCIMFLVSRPVSSQVFITFISMKGYVCFLLVIFIFCSCEQTAIKQSFSSADSLVIHFKNEQAGIVTKTVETAESKAIRKVIGFIEAQETEHFKCGYDGKMFFFSKGQQLQEVDFKMSDESCNHFSFLLHGKLMSTRMNNEAVDFLSALEKGLPYY